MIYLVLLSITILFLLNVLIIYSLKRMNSDGKKEITPVNISIIVALRNEESNVDGLVESLSSLDYPQENFEVILVDDNSTDGTNGKLILKTNTLKNFSALESKTSGVKGKRDTLAFGIQSIQISLHINYRC